MGLKAVYNNESDLDGTKDLEFVDKRMGATNTGLRRPTKTTAACTTMVAATTA